MTHVEIDARVAGRFRLADHSDPDDAAAAEYSGEYAEIVPPHRLVFTLRDGGGGFSRVVVEIAARSGGCELALLHERVPAERAARTEERWLGALYGLGETLAMLTTGARLE